METHVNRRYVVCLDPGLAGAGTYIPLEAKEWIAAMEEATKEIKHDKCSAAELWDYTIPPYRVMAKWVNDKWQGILL